VLTGKEIILGLLLFFALGVGAGVVGYLSNCSERRGKPRAWLAGLVAIGAGFALGYGVVELIITLESKSN
jgi:hypothetical protein